MMKLKRPSFHSFKEPVTLPGWAWWSFAYLAPLLLIVPLVVVVVNNEARVSAMIQIVAFANEHGLLEKAGAQELLKGAFSAVGPMSFLCVSMAAVVVMLFAVVMLSKQRKV